MTDRIPDSRTNASRAGVWSKRSSSRYVPVHSTRRVEQRAARRRRRPGSSVDLAEQRGVRGSRGRPPPGSTTPRPSPSSPSRSIIAPVAPRRRTDASMTAWRISSWSCVALTRPAISRSVRSASAVRASSPARAGQLLDQPGVGDRDGGLAGEGADEARVGLAERVALPRVDLDDARAARTRR